LVDYRPNSTRLSVAHMTSHRVEAVIPSVEHHLNGREDVPLARVL